MRTALCERWVFVTALVAAAAFACPASAAAEPASIAQATSSYEQAFALFKARKYSEAIALLDPYLAANPRDAKALTLRGDSKASLDDTTGALKDYNSAIEIAPGYEYAYVTRCETRLVLENLDGALSDCNKAISLDATDALAYEDRGDVYFEKSNYAAAAADYDRALKLGRSSAYLYAASCDANRLVKNLDRAAFDCDKAAALDPKSRRSLWAGARLAIVNGRYTDAIAMFNAYIAQQPSKSDVAYYFRGLSNNRAQRYTAALADLDIYVQRRPTDPDGYKERAVARYGLGDKPGAIADVGVAANGYRRQGDSAGVARTADMLNAIKAGQSL